LWVNPEIDQGFGLSNTLGLAGFPSGEAYKVGADDPYMRLPRFFIRQTIDFGAATECNSRGSAAFSWVIWMTARPPPTETVSVPGIGGPGVRSAARGPKSYRGEIYGNAEPTR
jgi:hypothetical protein